VRSEIATPLTGLAMTRIGLDFLDSQDSLDILDYLDKNDEE